MSHIDYRTDIPKHYVRKYCWLPACKEQKQAVKQSNKKPLRYFTFCAAEAIDVFMLEREQILQRSARTGRLEGVYFCEKDQEAFGKIADLIGSPEQGFQGDFVKIVLFEEDDETIGRSLTDDVPYSSDLRQKLRYKDAYHRFRHAFPFDIINLDVFGVMFPPRKGVITPLLKSLLRILEWQTLALSSHEDQLTQQFTLLLTSHIDPDITDKQAINQLIDQLAANINNNPEFQTLFLNRYGHQEVNKFREENFAEFFCLALPKFVIHQALVYLGWKVDHGPTYLYNRADRYKEGKKYQIMHSNSVYKRIPNFKQQSDKHKKDYILAVTQIINNGITWVDKLVEDPKLIEYLIEDLDQIVDFRDRARF